MGATVNRAARRCAPALCVVAALAGIGSTPAFAQDNGSALPASGEQATNPHEGGFFDRDVLTGDWGGERSALENHGVQFGLNLIGEVLGNPTGGIRTGAIYDGPLEMLLNLD